MHSSRRSLYCSATHSSHKRHVTPNSRLSQLCVVNTATLLYSAISRTSETPRTMSWHSPSVTILHDCLVHVTIEPPSDRQDDHQYAAYTVYLAFVLLVRVAHPTSLAVEIYQTSCFLADSPIPFPHRLWVPQYSENGHHTSHTSLQYRSSLASPRSDIALRARNWDMRPLQQGLALGLAVLLLARPGGAVLPAPVDDE